jgi:uroporphyrinogen decarboxylase
MVPKTRALTALSHEEPDRVPIDYLANPGIDRRLKGHFNLGADDDEGLLRALGVDFRALTAPYIGPPLHEELPDRRIDIWGIRTRWLENESGGYWDYCDFPLKEATLEEIEAWPMPSPDDFDYDSVAALARIHKDYCVVIGDPGFGDIINTNGMIRTMEQTLIDLMVDEPAALRLIERRLAIQLEVLTRCLDVAAGGIDLMWLGEDLGTQIGPMISPALYRKHFRPRHQRFVDLANVHGIPVMMHSCGSSSWAFDDFIDMGIKVIDTLQPEAANMDPADLKSKYGDRLSFHGCISTAGPVAYGTVDQTVESVRNILDIMTPGGGYAFSPTHLLQDNSPTENVLAMYETALTYH